MLRISLIGLLVLTAAPARAQDEYTRDWLRLESEHFRLVGGASERTIRRVGERLEEFRAAILAIMPDLEEAWQTETTVIVFPHDAAFSPFKPERDVAGYFTAGDYGNYIALNGDRDLERTIYHEYIHQLTKQERDWPQWLREGMAEFYSTLEISSRDRIIVGRGIVSHIEWLRGIIIPLEEFLDPQTRFDGDERTRSLYAQGWALFQYLQMARPGGVAQLNQFGRLMGASGNDVAASVQDAFGVDVATLEDEFVAYLRNSLGLRAREMPLEERLPEFDLPEAREISAAEASFYLGDLMVHIGNDDLAVEYLERSLELGGEFEPALTALYTLAERQGNTQAAAEFLERALATPDASWLPRLLEARNSLVAGPFEAVERDAVAELRRIIAEQPRLPDGHFWLGQALMQRPQTLDEAIQELQLAVGLSGGDPVMRVVHARAMWNAGNVAAARALVNNLARTTTDAYARSQANQLLSQIDARSGASSTRSAPPRPLPQPAPPSDTGDLESIPTLGRREEPAPPPQPVADGIPRPILPEGMVMFEGAVTYIGCIDFFELVVVSPEGSLRLRAPGLENVSLVSYSAAVQGEMPCGEIDPPLPARVIYTPDAGDGIDGEPVRVDFLP